MERASLTAFWRLDFGDVSQTFENLCNPEQGYKIVLQN